MGSRVRVRVRWQDRRVRLGSWYGRGLHVQLCCEHGQRQPLLNLRTSVHTVAIKGHVKLLKLDGRTACQKCMHLSVGELEKLD